MGETCSWETCTRVVSLSFLLLFLSSGRHSGRGGFFCVPDLAKIMELRSSDTPVMDALAECTGQEHTLKVLVYFTVLLVWYTYGG